MRGPAAVFWERIDPRKVLIMLTEECEATVKRSLLMAEFHKNAGAKMITFGQWEVPAYYTTIIDEHRCVRERVGIFDVSHMGEIVIAGKDARPYVQHLLTNNIDNYANGTAYYALMCDHKGGIVDDVFVYPVEQELVFLVVNASNIEKDHAWMLANNPFKDVTIDNVSAKRAMLACQGPLAQAVVSKVFDRDAQALGFHKFTEMFFEGEKVVVSASGYTGERGFEIMFANHQGPALWARLLELGEEYGIQPIGFGARDTLRIEAGCPLYGHELSNAILPFEVNLGWVVKLDKKADFIGKVALQKALASGVKRKLVGLEMLERSVPREGYGIMQAGKPVGVVTSGCYLPTIDKNAAMALINISEVDHDAPVDVAIRGRHYKAKIVKLPFYRVKK
jgi:aminomethyltransferase